MTSLISKALKISLKETIIIVFFALLLVSIFIFALDDSKKSCVISQSSDTYLVNYKKIKSIEDRSITFKYKNDKLITLSGNYELECYK